MFRLDILVIGLENFKIIFYLFWIEFIICNLNFILKLFGGYWWINFMLVCFCGVGGLGIGVGRLKFLYFVVFGLKMKNVFGVVLYNFVL